MPPTAARRRVRAAAVADAAARLACERGVVLPAHLRLWALAGHRPAVAADPTGAGTGVEPPARHGTPGTPGGAGGAGSGGGGSGSGGAGAGAGGGPAGDLAAVLEAATDAHERRSSGLHVTPRWVADHLVARALEAVGTGRAPASVCDPACGGGAFLVAAARALYDRGVPRAEVVRERLWGADIDPVGLAAAEAALALWSGGEVPAPGRLVVGDPLHRGATLWPDSPADGFDLVVGNPPFQTQLGRATARPPAVRRRLRERFGPALRAYTDTAWLFLLLGCQLARPGGRVVLVQPDSLVAARDATAVRDAVDDAADLLDLWVDDRQVFAASVRVCAPILQVRRLAAAGGGQDRSAPGAGGAAQRPARAHRPSRWRDLLAGATGVPAVELAASADRLGDRAALAAGFRDEYYGLAELVCEAGPDGPGPGQAALVTAGVVDWGSASWGQRPVRFAKRSWAAPVVDLARLEADGTAAARRWVERTRGPKLVVATQTRVVEVAVDESGDWVPSVPAIAVVPRCPSDLWPLAAALAAPAATAWLLRRAPGAALSRGALKIAAGDLADLPLPGHAAAWEAATSAFRQVARDAVGAPVPGSDAPPDPAPDPGAFEAFVAAAAAAYGSSPALVRWWRGRSRATAGLPTGPVGDGSD